MGKNWKGGRGGGGGGGAADLGSCRGLGVVIGTCDAARERETSKELLNLFTQMLEDLEPSASASAASPAADSEDNVSDESNDDDCGAGQESVASMLAKELSGLRGKKATLSQPFMSVQTGVKGIVLIKILKNSICPVGLVKSVFRKVRSEGLALTRHVVRLIPLQRVFFPNESDLTDNVQHLVSTHLGFTIEVEQRLSAPKVEGDDRDEGSDRPVKRLKDEVSDVVASAAPSEEPSLGTGNDCLLSSSVASATSSFSPSSGGEVDVAAFTAAIQEKLRARKAASLSASGPAYAVSFKARNHSILTRDVVYRVIESCLPPGGRLAPRHYQVTLVPLTRSSLCNVIVLCIYMCIA